MVDHYARMKFKMGSSVVYNGQVAKVTGWSTNGEEEENATYSYQLNGGELVKETELTASAEPAESASASTPAESSSASTPAESS